MAVFVVQFSWASALGLQAGRRLGTLWETGKGTQYGTAQYGCVRGTVIAPQLSNFAAGRALGQLSIPLERLHLGGRQGSALGALVSLLKYLF